MSPTPINMSECTLNIQIHETKNEKPNETINITKKT